MHYVLEIFMLKFVMKEFMNFVWYFFSPACSLSIKNCHNSFFLLFVKVGGWPEKPDLHKWNFHLKDSSIFLKLLNMRLSCRLCKLMTIILFCYERIKMFHFINDCDSFTKTMIVFCNMFFKLFYCIKSARTERFCAYD